MKFYVYDHTHPRSGMACCLSDLEFELLRENTPDDVILWDQGTPSEMVDRAVEMLGCPGVSLWQTRCCHSVLRHFPGSPKMVYIPKERCWEVESETFYDDSTDCEEDLAMDIDATDLE